jgi:hypothetical protein
MRFRTRIEQQPPPRPGASRLTDRPPNYVLEHQLISMFRLEPPYSVFAKKIV